MYIQAFHKERFGFSVIAEVCTSSATGTVAVVSVVVVLPSAMMKEVQLFEFVDRM